MAQKNASKKDMPEWAKMELENAKQDEYTKKAQDAYHKIMPNPEMKKKGGKIKFSTCGEKGRLCAQVRTDLGEFGQNNENLMILKGY